MPLNFSITFLGTSAASISPHSSTSAYLIAIGRTWILVDAGIGALRQLRKLGVSPDDIDTILITHWHFDHYAGLPSVLRAKKKSSAISIYGPAILHFARLYLNALFCPIDKMFEAIKEDFSRTYPDFHLRSIPTSHFISSFGWAIKENNRNQPFTSRRLIISGDTRPNENVVQAARGADLLVHEATYLDKYASTAILHQHSTAKEAAQVAVKSGVGALALTHIPARYSRLDIQEEAQKIFPLTLVPAHLDTFHLDPPPNGEVKENIGWARIRIESHSIPYP
jgi:ribonuclease Z